MTLSVGGGKPHAPKLFNDEGLHQFSHHLTSFIDKAGTEQSLQGGNINTALDCNLEGEHGLSSMDSRITTNSSGNGCCRSGDAENVCSRSGDVGRHSGDVGGGVASEIGMPVKLIEGIGDEKKSKPFGRLEGVLKVKDNGGSGIMMEHDTMQVSLKSNGFCHVKSENVASRVEEGSVEKDAEVGDAEKCAVEDSSKGTDELHACKDEAESCDRKNSIPVEYQAEDSINAMIESKGTIITDTKNFSLLAHDSQKKMSECGLQKDFESSDSSFTLHGILEGLARLDENGIFSKTSAGSTSGDYSNHLRSKIFFSVMMEKAYSNEYRTWREFKEDFEEICNSFIHNENRDSEIWNAAHKLLQQGREYLEGFADRSQKLFDGTIKVKDSDSIRDFNKNTNDSCSDPSNKKCIMSAQNYIIQSSNDRVFLRADESVQTICDSTFKCAQNMVSVEVPEESKFNDQIMNTSESNFGGYDNMVEILNSNEQENRVDSPEEASECSSSFGDTDVDMDSFGSDLKVDAAEAESGPWNEDIDSYGAQKRKGALRPEWKDFRRHIEWRCHWLQLRYSDLLSRASKYDRILAGIQSRKQQEGQFDIDASSTRSSSIKKQNNSHPVLRRRRRRKLENTADLSSYLLRHPVYSLYGKQEKLDADGALHEDDSYSLRMASDPSSIRFDNDDSEDPQSAMETKEGASSFEYLFCQIEILQSRVQKMNAHLNKHFSGIGRACESSKGTLHRFNSNETGTSKVQDSTLEDSLKSQRVSEDPFPSHIQENITHCVLPSNEVPAYLEAVHHSIESDLPLDQREREDSSDEVTIAKPYMEPVFVNSKEQFNENQLFSVYGSETVNYKRDASTLESEENIPNNSYLPFNIHVPRMKRRKINARPSSSQFPELVPPIECSNVSLQPEFTVNARNKEIPSSVLQNEAKDAS